MRAMRNYAGHRLSPWLGHLMVSRTDTARPLLTPGEVMQLAPTDEILMVAGTPPIRAKKARYFEDDQLKARILPLPSQAQGVAGTDDWSAQLPGTAQSATTTSIAGGADDSEGSLSGHRQQPELTPVPQPAARLPLVDEFGNDLDQADLDQDTAAQLKVMRGVARQVALDPGDGMDL
jgi:type IV secretion system protein VirD4